jgi:hypothetical protein
VLQQVRQGGRVQRLDQQRGALVDGIRAQQLVQALRSTISGVMRQGGEKRSASSASAPRVVRRRRSRPRGLPSAAETA